MPFALAGLFLLATTDIAERRIPKNLNLLVSGLSIFELSALINGIWVWFLYLVIFRASSGGVGYGDVRLAPLTALIAADLGELVALHAGAWVLAGMFLLFRKGWSQVNLPFAPFIALSAGLLQVG